MVELLATYSVTEIIVFVVLLALALKEVFNLYDFFKARAKLRLTTENRTEEDRASLHSLMGKIDKIEERLNLLTESDKDDIKGWLIEKYNYHKTHPDEEIDTFTMDIIEKRFKHYEDEGGNGYIKDTVMPALRKVAKEESNVSV